MKTNHQNAIGIFHDLLSSVLCLRLLMIEMMICISSFLFAQTEVEVQTPQHNTFSSACGQKVVNNIQWQWTLGEAFSGSFFAENQHYTVGFHQPMITIQLSSGSDILCSDNMSVFPNPFKDILHIHMKQMETGSLNLVIFDDQGRIVRDVIFQAGDPIKEVYIPEIPAGHYTLVVIDANKAIMGRVHIIKSH